MVTPLFSLSNFKIMPEGNLMGRFFEIFISFFHKSPHPNLEDGEFGFKITKNNI